jgi:hypothetical protein
MWLCKVMLPVTCSPLSTYDSGRSYSLIGSLQQQIAMHWKHVFGWFKSPSLDQLLTRDRQMVKPRSAKS